MAAAMAPDMLEQPTLKNLTHNYGVPHEKQNEYLQTLGTPHVDSFNSLLGEGMAIVEAHLAPLEFDIPSVGRLRLIIENLRFNSPTLPPGTLGSKSMVMWPTECRQRQATYKGHLLGVIKCTVNGVEISPVEKDFGQLPIMVKSNACHLSKLTPAELIAKGEHGDEWGGYFIVKGHEKLIRMLLMTRRNYPVAVHRSGWKKRGALFSDLGVLLRCVAEDHTSTTNVLHYVNDGSASLMFSSKKALYFAPICLILKCLLDVTDEYIWRTITAGFEHDHFFKGCVLNMLRNVHLEGINSHLEAKSYVGRTFRIKFPELPPWLNDAQICDHILKQCVAIHLTDNQDKFNLFAMMTQKLFAIAQDKSCVEGVDSIMVQEVLLGGHLYQQIIKEKLQGFLYMLKALLVKKSLVSSFKLTTFELNNCIKRCASFETSMTNFLSTGNLNSYSGLNLMQDKGLCIVAENINRMRYMSHFRSIHRGAYFMEMRTTEARQLLPDAWGFICPVHTPDGAPCGLLNHLSKECQITTSPDPKLLANVPSILLSLGMIPLDLPMPCALSECYLVMLDGRVLGRVPFGEAKSLVNMLRLCKLQGTEVPNTMEIALVPKGVKCGQHPGLFLFTGSARMIRPVFNLAAQKVEMVGTFEQLYLEICIKPEEAYEGLTTHRELTEIDFLSNLACLIPMPDCNQSPRNMYQCQMGKQTMGTPTHLWHNQAETKLYRLQTPATPLFRPVHYDKVALDDFPMGTNAIVAVISYTGYDMEDAMIINKSSYERGFAHGSVYKSEFVELTSSNSYFSMDPSRAEILGKTLDEDGLPRPGAVVKNGDALACYFFHEENKYRVHKASSSETMYIDNVRLCGGANVQACITYRITRNPSVGDKFASRAGQKGICSRLWPSEDLPFTESGMVPDIVFNPHGFPSRMTIAMMIEIMAGKSAVLHGLVHDATPFRFNEKDTAIDFFGRMLEAGGYNYYGTEKMYSGTDGRAMNVAIFFGVVHYQRLRHMVSDKWQVRSTGPIDIVTRQPVKGRRRGGGVRFGEMERDSLLSHGAAFLLQDRLFHCSDKHSTLVCRTCGSIISSYTLPKTSTSEGELWCQVCREKGEVGTMELPYIFRYFVTQMAAVNIKIVIDVKGDED